MYRVAYATKIIVVLTATLVGSVDFVYAVSVPRHSSWNAISKSKLITQIASQYSERTAETQRALKALGHYSGEIDGISGPQTFDAIREFQHNNLKSSPTGHLGKYEREVLISLGRSAVENQKNQALIENFELFNNTDFPGGDILTPVEDTTLRGLTVQECSARCIETHGCRSFTFNQNRNWCYLKGEHTTRGPFQNAVSGILNPLESTKEAEWKAPDNLDPRIADYPERLAAYRYAGKCNDETELIRERQSQTKVDVNVSSPRVGDKGIIQWSSSQEPTSLPVYIIVSASAPVRFSGAGFYALTPNARAPFSIDTYQETTRVIVPLYGKDVPKEGEITLLPIQTGELELKWRIVGYLRGCGEILHSQEQSLNITVRPGKPSIYVQDPFSLIEPKQRFVSASRDHTLQVFDSHYRVVNRDGEAVIQSREGKEPRFSNTGRFVTARLEEGVEILDVLTRERIFQVGSNVLGDLGWINNDSFAIAPNGQGGTSIFNTLGTTDARNYQGSYWFVGGGGPYAATGTYAPISIDLENNLIAFIAPSFAGLTSITSAFEASLPIPAWMGDTQPNFQPVHSRVRSLLEKSHKLASLRLPSKNWEAEEGVKFTNLTINEYVSESNDPNSYRKSLLVQPIPQNDQTDLGIVSEKNANASVTRWRGIGVTGTQIISDTSLNNRLKDFGINILDGIDPHGKIAKIKEINDQKFYGFDSLPNIKIVSDFNCWTEAVSISETICIGFQNVRGMMWSLGERSIALFAGNVDGGNRAFLDPRVYLYDSTANTKLVDFINVIPDASSTGPYCSSKLLACQFAGHIVADRWLVLWSTESRASAIYDLKNQKLVSSFAFMEKGELIDKIHMMEDEKHVLQMNQDGSLFIYNIGSQKRIILGRYEDDEIIVWSPDGHYDATAEGAHFVNVRFSGKAGQFTFEQFERQLRVPDLLAKILNNEPIQKNSIDDVGVPPELAVSLTQKEKRIRGEASFASENPLVQINLYQDGLLTDRIDVANNVSSVPIDVAHADGARWISLLAVDNKGLISQPAGLMIANKINTKSRIHLLAVGINKYTQPSLTDLEYARNDAQAIKNTLENLPSVEAGKLLSITDELNPTPSTILSNAEAIVDQAEIGDTLIFSFSGHGLRDDDGQFYLATPQTDAGKISQTALPWAKLGEIFSKSKARVIVFLDACRSGLADDNLFASNDDAAATLLDKVTSGISVISASKGRELAFERADLRGGIFTNALIEVIHGSRNRYDTNKNGAIEISELYRGIKELVVLRSNAEQTPWLTRNQMVGNFAIF